MTPRIETLLALLRSGEYKALREPALLDNTPPAGIANAFLADAYRLKTLLTTVEHQLLTQLTELQFTLRLSLEKSAMCDLLLDIYSREDVPDLAAAIQLTTL